MRKSKLLPVVAAALSAAVLPISVSAPVVAQDPQSWGQPEPYVSAPGPDRMRESAPRGSGYLGSQAGPPDASQQQYGQPPSRPAAPAAGSYGRGDDAYRPAPPASYGNGMGGGGAGAGDVYVLPPQQRGGSGGHRQDDAYRAQEPAPYAAPSPGAGRGYADNSGRSGGYDAPYSPRSDRYQPGPRYEEDREGAPYRQPGQSRTYSQNEVIDTGHRFFGSVSTGLAKAVEYVFQQSGRPNGYILGEDAGGAFIAGLRYGEGTLYTKDAGNHRVYWQGPSLGYDFGGEGSKTMVLVYNLRHPSDIYHRFGGVQGAAYLVGGVSVQFQKHGDVVLAPIRSGVGLRLGANVGYLKYTRRPTWNPF